MALLVSALLMSRFGIIDLVAIGYGALTWTFLAVLVVPLFTVGLWKIRRG